MQYRNRSIYKAAEFFVKEQTFLYLPLTQAAT